MDPSPLGTAALFAGLFALVLQLVDAVTGTLDARSVRDDDSEQSTDTRARDLGWSVAVTVLLSVLVAFSIDAIARAADDPDDPLGLGATLLLLALVTIATFAVGMVGVIAAVRRERPAYARIRRDLRDRPNLVMTPDELIEFDTRLARVDAARERPVHASSVLRVIGLVLVIAVSVILFIVAVGADAGGGVVASVVAIVLSVAAFVVGFRTAAVRGAATEALSEAQRGEVVALLERARIPGRRTVPGLRDRVSRALAILREQQR